jgi:nucleotide-binding universal stress UspA family protein
MKVLLPTDFSGNAKLAVDFAISLFGMEAEYTLLNLYHEPHAAATSMISLVDIAMQDSRNSLIEELEHFKSKYGEDLKMGYLSEYGEGGRQISNLAGRYNQDIIIMGTKGASGLKEVLVGSVASDTLSKSEKPVMIVPMGEWGIPKVMAAAVDDKVDAEALGRARKFADIFKAKLNFLKVESNDAVPAGNNDDTKPSYVEPGEVYSQIFAEDPVQGITQFVHDNKVDMLIMFPGHHGFLDRLFKRSNTGKVAMHSKVPLLTIHK